MLRQVLAALAALFLSGPLLAQSVTWDAAYDKFRSASLGNIATVSYGSDGTPLVKTGGPLGAASNSSGVTLSRGAALSTSAGNVPFTVSQRFSKAAIARGAGAVLGGPLGVALLAGPFVYDWLQDGGFTVDRATGEVFKESSIRTCTAVHTSFGYREFTAPSCTAAANSMTDSIKGDGKIVSAYITKCVAATTSGAPPGCGAGWDDGTDSMGVGYNMSYPPGSTPTLELATPSEIQTSLNATPRTGQELEDILKELLQRAGYVPDPDPADKPQVSDPGSTAERTTTETTTNPDGSTDTTTRKCKVTASVTVGSPAVKLSESCVVTTTKTGPTGDPSAPTTTTKTTTDETAPSTSPKEEPAPFEMPCGIAGTPPCNVKADETGTATAVPELADPEALAKSPLTPYEQLKNSPSGFWPTLPTINWSFQMPTGCGVISVPGFAPFLESIDICPWQSLFHEIMTVVWVLGGLFGAISTFWRNTFATV